MTAVAAPAPAQFSAAESRSFPWEKAWWVPLAVILAAQAAVTLRLMSYWPSSDEGRYIYSGHQLIYELWHGGGSPFYETYFSGAPDIYPPIAALADHFGGIVGVRFLNMIFMLAVTVLLFATTRRLFGYGAGLTAASLYSTLALVHSMGAFANYDAMSLLLLASAAYCAVRAGEPGARSRWLLLVPALLLAANATKYPTLVFDPVVITMAALRSQGWRAVCHRATALATATVVLVLAVAYLAGTAYIHGAMFTTLNRPKGTNIILAAAYTTPRVIVWETSAAIGVILVPAALAVLLGAARRQHVMLLLVLLGAGLLVMAEALHLHSDESMDQHNTFAAWFACIAAGYALWPPVMAKAPRPLRWGATLGISALVLASGIHFAHYSRVIATVSKAQVQSGLRTESTMRPYLNLKTGRYLIGGALDEMIYMDHVNIPWFRLSDDNYLKYPIPGRGGDTHGQTPGRVCTTPRAGCMYLEGSPAYRAAIHAHYFAFILLGGRSTLIPQDKAIEKTVRTTPGYVQIPGAPMWIYAPAYERYAHAG